MRVVAASVTVALVVACTCSSCRTMSPSSQYVGLLCEVKVEDHDTPEAGVSGHVIYEVYLDGKLVHGSDTGLVKGLVVKVGSHMVKVESEGYQTQEKTIHILKGMRNQQITFLLKRKSPQEPEEAGQSPRQPYPAENEDGPAENGDGLAENDQE